MIELATLLVFWAAAAVALGIIFASLGRGVHEAQRIISIMEQSASGSSAPVIARR
jgi:F0F1-type ATP synthase membrane subunit c/vacuolar-type H+-ATPase subunit K